mgnify:CR=1 FL=1
MNPVRDTIIKCGMNPVRKLTNMIKTFKLFWRVLLDVFWSEDVRFNFLTGLSLTG